MSIALSQSFAARNASFPPPGAAARSAPVTDIDAVVVIARVAAADDRASPALLGHRPRGAMVDGIGGYRLAPFYLA